MLGIGLAAAWVYSNTLGHGFVLDDEMVIVRNDFVRQGPAGLADIFGKDSFAGYQAMANRPNALPGGRYRPLSLAVFSVWGKLFSFHPSPFHLLAVGVYVLLCLLVFQWFRKALARQRAGETIAGITALLFALHPVHTEVVANVKSLDESLSMLLAILALGSLWSYHEKGRWWSGGLAVLFTLLACLAKETACSLILLGPASIFFLTEDKGGSILRSSLPVWVGAAAYLAIRLAVVGWPGPGGTPDLLNDPFLAWTATGWEPVTAMVRGATLGYTALRYVWLLLWPFDLTHDYYPYAIGFHSFREVMPWVGILLVLAVGALAVHAWRWRDPAGLGWLWILAAMAPVSNVVLPTGTFMAERFLFLPSLGFCYLMALGYAWLVSRTGQGKITWTVLLGALVVLGGVKTFSRNRDWANNETLLRSAASLSANSAKWRNDMGTILLDSALVLLPGPARTAKLDSALADLSLATQWHPTYYNAWLARGACACYLEDFRQCEMAYRTARQLDPESLMAYEGWKVARQLNAGSLLRQGKPEEGIPWLRDVWQVQQDTATGTLIGRLYDAAGKPDSAMAWFARARALAPSDPRLQALRPHGIRADERE